MSRLTLTRPFTTPRPESYADIPAPIGRRAAAGMDLPPGPRDGNRLSTLWSFQRDTPGFLMGLREQFGDAVSFFLNGQLFIGLWAPAMVHEVTTAQQSAFVKGVGFARMRKVLGEGLLTNEEPVHLRHRRMMQPPFHKPRLDAYAAQMDSLAEEQIGSWPEDGRIDLAPEMMRLTLRIVAQTLFGTDADRHADRIAHSMDIAINRIERTMLPGLDRLDGWPIPYFRRFGSAADDLAEVAESLIFERKEAPARDDDLLGLLLALRDEDGSGFTDEEVRDEALTLILSGHETTANALTWAFCWLTTRPEVLAALQAEADATEWLREERRPSMAEALEPTIAGRIVSESLRLAPPVWIAPRRALRDVDVCGVRVPAGAHVLVSQYVTHRDARSFAEPSAWKPERWTPDLEASLPRGAYFPFGGGTRKCLGEHFALVESRIILLRAARRFDFLPADAAHPMPKPDPRATYRARGNVPIRVRRRS